MTARGRNNLTDWDPMKEDFNNSSYDAQYQDNDNSSHSGQTQLDHSKLYITNIPPGLNEQGLRSAFEKYGQVEHTFLSRDPTKRFALVTYETAAEARIAMMKLNKTEPLNFNINVAHARNSSASTNNNIRNTNGTRGRERNRESNRGTRESERGTRESERGTRESERGTRESDHGHRESERVHRDSGSYVSSSSRDRNSRNQEERGSAEMESLNDPMPAVAIDRDFHIELEQIKLRKLKLQEEQLECKQKMMLLQLEKQPMSNVNTAGGGSSRRILPDGRRIIVQTQADKSPEPDKSFTAGAGDSNETSCSCPKSWTKNEASDEGSSTPSTCVLCSEERTPLTRSKRNSIEKSEISKTTDVKTSEYSSKNDPSRTTSRTKESVYSKDLARKQSSQRCEGRKCACKVRSGLTNDWKLREFCCDSDDESDETNRLIQLRHSDYQDIVDDNLKLVIALPGYPKTKVQLRHLEVFQRCLTEVINMQLKANLLKKVPSFLDYYLNRGALVCICKDMDTKDWMVRITPGLQERMTFNLLILNTKVKRFGLATLKIPRASWPTTAEDCFKLLQYFNPLLKTSAWKIYSQRVISGVECTSFLVDRVSSEIIRGPNFKNIVDYDQMDLEFTGYTEIYYECMLADMVEDFSSVTSRIKLLEEIKSANTTPRLPSTVSVKSEDLIKPITEQLANTTIKVVTSQIIPEASLEQEKDEEIIDVKKEDRCLEDEISENLKKSQHIGDDKEVLVWSDEAVVDGEIEPEFDKPEVYLEENNTTNTSLGAMSEKTESIAESLDNLIIKTSTINIDSNRGIAYHRRTNYLHVENELKVAITLDGYPQNKLEGTHIRRLKHLFKEYLHKDMKSQRFANLIIPKFQDIYLSNGAVIYICDSLETRDYLTEVLPKFINSTGLKLTFRDITNLVRYTRIVMRLPKEMANIESIEILLKLQEKYPGLKPNCWKYYCDVAGKQKRQFGVDPESLEVIKDPDFDPIFQGEKLVFRIIDRQKRDVSCDDTNKDEAYENEETKKLRQVIVNSMYVSIEQETAPLTRIRTNHYSDLIADDLKLYVGPVNYPDFRIDEPQFHSIKRTFESIVLESVEKGDICDDSIPKFHDMYLFDGVIFIICQSMYSRLWIENNVDKVNDKLKINLKPTEFRGAVGIINMIVKTDKDTDEVIKILQEQNPRLRTKYWRKISTVNNDENLDVVLQIDKLSAQVISEPDFNKLIGHGTIQFNLGHLQTLIKPKSNLLVNNQRKKSGKITKRKTKKSASTVSIRSNKNYRIDETVVNDSKLVESPKFKREEIQMEPKLQDLDPTIVEQETSEGNDFAVSDGNFQSKIILKIPMLILPESESDLNIIFDILEDKNPGLNTEIWQVYTESPYPSNGKFILYVDKQSLAVIQNKQFDSTVGGEKLMFYF